jgi:hypothetical protein
MIVLSFSLLVVIGLATAAVMLIRMMAPAGQSLPLTAEWISDLSTERYKPMMRLLNSADIEFLRSQPGYTRNMEATLRMQRCQVFRGYLRCLNSDFHRVCMALKIVMAQSDRDRADLASVLMHQQMMFASGMLMIHFRLVLFRWGMGNVDVTPLVRIFDGMRAELCTLVPSTASACA